MGYFCFDLRDKDKKNHRNLLLSPLLQLCAQSDICCDILSRLHSAHNGGRKTPSDDALTKCLKQMLSFTSQHPLYLVMDALDECPKNLGLPSPREQVFELVKDPVDLHPSADRGAIASAWCRCRCSGRRRIATTVARILRWTCGRCRMATRSWCRR